MSYIEDKYINFTSSHLKNFKRIQRGFRFSCPYCGDSKKDKSKARGYLLERGRTYSYYCHNCNISKSYTQFLKDNSPSHYDEYIFEKFKCDTPDTKKNTEKINFNNNDDILKYCVDLRLYKNVPLHVKEYLFKRKIPNTAEIYYIEDINVLKEKLNYESTFISDDKLIIPIRNRQKKLIALLCRSLNETKTKNKYIIMKIHDEPLIYNIENLNMDQTKYVVEGPIDSFFVKNSVAALGLNLSKTYDMFDDNTVYVFDNQPRNITVIKNMCETIEKNKKIVIWPENIKEKDINDMLISNIDYMNIIENNTYQNLKAKLKLSNWRKI